MEKLPPLSRWHGALTPFSHTPSQPVKHDVLAPRSRAHRGLVLLTVLTPGLRVLLQADASL